MLQVTGAKKSTVREKEDANEERVITGSQECLLSIGDKGSEGFEKLLPDKFGPLSAKGLERIVELDPIVLLGLLYESLVDRGSAGSNVVPVDKEMPRSGVDYI